MIRGSAIATALVVTFATLSPAFAQPAGAQAEALFDKGKKLMAEGKISDACTAFESSQKLDPQVTTLMNLAACREKNGELASAWAWFIETERLTRGKQGGEKKLNQTSKDRAGKLEGRISKLTINVKNEVVGLEVLRDNTPVERGGWNTPLPVDGGSFKIVARAPGYEEWSGMVTVANEKDNKSIDVPKLEKATAGNEVGAGTGSGTGSGTGTGRGAGSGDGDGGEQPAVPSRALPIALAVTGVALAGGAVGFELWGRSKYDASKVEPDDQTQEDLWKAANARRYMAIGMGSVAAVSLGVSIFLFVRSPKQATERQVARRVRVQPVASTQLTGLLVQGSW